MARSRLCRADRRLDERLPLVSGFANTLFWLLPMIADCKGYLQDKPNIIKVELMPFHTVDVEALLAELAAQGLITRYEVAGQKWIWCNCFPEDQSPHINEVRNWQKSKSKAPRAPGDVAHYASPSDRPEQPLPFEAPPAPRPSTGAAGAEHGPCTGVARPPPVPSHPVSVPDPVAGGGGGQSAPPPLERNLDELARELAEGARTRLTTRGSLAAVAEWEELEQWRELAARVDHVDWVPRLLELMDDIAADPRIGKGAHTGPGKPWKIQTPARFIEHLAENRSNFPSKKFPHIDATEQRTAQSSSAVAGLQFSTLVADRVDELKFEHQRSGKPFGPGVMDEIKARARREIAAEHPELTARAQAPPAAGQGR